MIIFVYMPAYSNPKFVVLIQIFKSLQQNMRRMVVRDVKILTSYQDVFQPFIKDFF